MGSGESTCCTYCLLYLKLTYSSFEFCRAGKHAINIKMFSNLSHNRIEIIEDGAFNMLTLLKVL
jgi:hypothetical protein